jgi:DNA-binding response OmpR family regulator
MLRYFERGVLPTVIGPGGERRVRRPALAAFMDDLRIPRGSIMPQRWRVLVADRDDLIALVLDREGGRESRFEIRSVSTGRDLLRCAKRWRPHVLIVNRTLQGARAAPVVCKLRATPSLRRVPVIMIGALPRRIAERHDPLPGDVDAYLSKPFGRKHLVGCILRVLLERWGR